MLISCADEQNLKKALKSVFRSGISLRMWRVGANVPQLNVSFLCGRFFKKLWIPQQFMIVSGRSMLGLSFDPLTLSSSVSMKPLWSVSYFLQVCKKFRDRNPDLNQSVIEHTNSLTFSIFLQGRWFLPSWIPRRTSVAGIGRAAGNSLLWVRHEPAGKMEKKSWGAWKEAGPSPAASVLPQHALWAAILTERAVTDKHQLTNRVGEDRQSSLSLSGTLFLQNTKARSSTYALRTWLPSQRDGCRGPLSICCTYMQMHAA